MSFEQGYEEFMTMAKEIENDTTLNENQKNNKVIALIKKVNEVNHQMQVKITAVDIYRKQMAKNILKIDNEINYENNASKQAKEDTKKIVGSIKEAKKLYDRMSNEHEKQNKEIDKKFNELKKKIESKIDFDINDIEKLEAINKEMQKEINDKIDEFEVKKKENKDRLIQLESSYKEFNSENTEKLDKINQQYESIKVVQHEFDKLEKQNNMMVKEVNDIFQKLQNYDKIVSMKNTSYISYQKDLRELVDTSYKLYSRQKDIEIANKQASTVIMSIMSENEQLSKQLNQEEQKTEEFKKLCKEKQEIIKNIN